MDSFGNEVVIFNLTKKNFKDWEQIAKKAALLVLKVNKVRNAYLEIFFLSDKESRKLNKFYRKKDKVANVLSFAWPKGVLRPDIGRKKFLGVVFLAPSFIKRKKENFLLMVVHGVLHLLGYVHKRKKDAIIMSEKEKEVLALL